MSLRAIQIIYHVDLIAEWYIGESQTKIGNYIAENREL